MHIIYIIGGGVAGCSAAIMLLHNGYNVIIHSGLDYGGQIVQATRVENYPGYNGTGYQLFQTLKQQVINLGGQIINDNIVSFDALNKSYTDSSGTIYTYDSAIIIATGKAYCHLNIKNEEKFIGKGISYCALCDGRFYKGEDTVVVVGGGDSAVNAALYLATMAKHVNMIVRSDKMRANERYRNILSKTTNISVIYNAHITELYGDEQLSGICINDDYNIKTKGLFVAIGLRPQTEIFENQINLDDKGYIITDAQCRTNVPRIYAAGDVVSGIYKQAIIASGNACTAAITIIHDLSEI